MTNLKIAVSAPKQMTNLKIAVSAPKHAYLNHLNIIKGGYMACTCFKNESNSMYCEITIFLGKHMKFYGRIKQLIPLNHKDFFY